MLFSHEGNGLRRVFLTRRLLPHGGWDFMANELAGPFSVTTSISGNIIQSAFELIPVRLAS